MKLYKRADFIKLPEKTIYSRVKLGSGQFWEGLYCKTSGDDWLPDWIEQELICNPATPPQLVDGGDQHAWIEDQINLLHDLQNDYNCAGRDGFFDDKNLFVVWDRTDIQKLISFLQNCIE
jgi:hypothetical protein